MSGSMVPDRKPADFHPVAVANGDIPPPTDELPPDAEPPEYELLTQFLAYVRASRITIGGELEIVLGVPFEFKYDAMPVTDLRGLNFHLVVYRPVEPKSLTGGGE